MTNVLSFNDVSFDVIDQCGQPWLQSRQIASALGYKDENSVRKIFERNRDEFSESMTTTVNLTVGITPTNVRIFSLRGCHLLAMFARTAIAKKFRVWVLNILDTETLTPTALTASTPADRKPLRDILHVWTQRSNLLHSQAWKMVAAHFELETATQLPVEWLADAIAFVQAKIDALPVLQAQPQIQQSMELELLADNTVSKFTPYMYKETKEKLIKLERDLSSLHTNLNIYCRCGGMEGNDFSRNREFIKIIEASVNTLQDNVRAAISQVQVTKKVFSLMQ